MSDRDKVAGVIYSRYKDRARRKGIPWGLTRAQVYEMIFKPCYYCGTKGANSYKIKWGDAEAFTRVSYRGMDRKSPKRGYSEKNVVPSCGSCNLGKQSMTEGEFKKWIKKVANHLSKTTTTPST